MLTGIKGMDFEMSASINLLVENSYCLPLLPTVLLGC